MLWSIFERVRAGLQSRKLITYAELFSSLAAAISKNKKVVFDFAVVDEAQDISAAHLRFFAALGEGRPNALARLLSIPSRPRTAIRWRRRRRRAMPLPAIAMMGGVLPAQGC